jgi:hypothetical protein
MSSNASARNLQAPRPTSLGAATSIGRQGSSDEQRASQLSYTDNMSFIDNLRSTVSGDWGGVQMMRKRTRSRSIFPNLDVMKHNIKQQMMSEKYDVANYYKQTGCAQAVARHSAFEMCTLIVIFFNSIWIAVDTDYNDQELLINSRLQFQIAEHMFTTYFFIEIIIRFAAFEEKKNCLGDVWYVFDACLVILMVLETWLMTLIIGISNGYDLGNVSILRIARLFRLTRMARLARLVRAIPELVILMKGMLAAARSVFFTLMLLVVLLYVFGIAFTQLMKATPAGKQFFPSVGESMNTLWLYATLLEEITTLSHALSEENLWAVALLDLFILAASLTVMNMLIGVLCEVVSSVASSEREASSFALVKSKVEKVFYELGLDSDGDGTITRAEFTKIVENREAAKSISELGVDVMQLLDMADFIFEDDESIEGGEKTLPFSEFMETLSEFRGQNTATVKDVMQLRKFLRVELFRQTQSLQQWHLEQQWLVEQARLRSESHRLSVEDAAIQADMLAKRRMEEERRNSNESQKTPDSSHMDRSVDSASSAKRESLS